jgi:hypothetical protein
MSSAACVQGSSWSYEGDALWVDRGCRATFEISPATVGGPGFGDVRAMAVNRCNLAATNAGFTVRSLRLLEIGVGHADVEMQADNRGILVDLICRYDTSSGSARIYRG